MFHVLNLVLIPFRLTQDCERKNEPWQHERECQQGNQHQPVEEHVSGYGCYQCPRIRGEEAKFGRKIVVIFPQMLNRVRLMFRYLSGCAQLWLYLIYAARP